jgi:hypothetical protein
VLSPETAALLEGGCALIVGSADRDKVPHAARGWGITVLSRDPIELRLLVDAHDPIALANLVPEAKIAITGGDVATLHSIQLKGTVRATEPGTDDDRARAARYADEFFADVGRTDGTPRELMTRLLALDVVACTVHVDELYDQTPGPGAGASMPEGSS